MSGFPLVFNVSVVHTEPPAILNYSSDFPTPALFPTLVPTLESLLR